MSTRAVYFLKQVYSDIIKKVVLLAVLLSEACSVCIWDEEPDIIQVELVHYSSAVAVDQLLKLLFP